MHERSEDGQVIRRRGDRVAVEAQHLARRVDRMRDQAAGDHLQRMERVLERGRDAEVAAAAAKRPEQIRIGFRVHVEDAPVGSDELDCGQVVGREPVLRHQPAEPAAEGEASDSRGRDRAAGDREPVRRGLAVQLAPEHATLRPHRARARVDVDALHRRQVDHQRAVDHRAPGDVVAAAAHTDVQTLRAREPDRVRDVRRVLAARDQRRPPVDQPVVDAPRVVVAFISRLQDIAGKHAPQLLEPLSVDACRCRHLVSSRRVRASLN